MRFPLLAVMVVTGYALLTGARIPVFASERALWMAALPSASPRVSVNVGAALIGDGDYLGAAVFAAQAWELAERPASAYERKAVRELVRNQLAVIDAFTGICATSSYQRYCSE